jgi:hypothetical protein
MSDQAVRAAIQAFLASPELPGVQKVYKDVPWFIDGAQWNVAGNDGWAGIISVHLNTSQESRVTLPALTGSKQVNHTIGLVIQYQYLIPTYFAPGEAEDSWVDGLDIIVDGIKDRIRSNPTFNSNGIIFQAGQDDSDIRITRDVPTIDVGRVVAWNLIEFNLTEIIQA